MTLFQHGHFILRSRLTSRFRINCEALTAADWDALARLVADDLNYGVVEGVPTGGDPFAEALRRYARRGGPLLIADDVLTTGGAMEEHRAGREAIGVVVFSRGLCPPWVTPMFELRWRS